MQQSLQCGDSRGFLCNHNENTTKIKNKIKTNYIDIMFLQCNVREMNNRGNDSCKAEYLFKK